MLELINENAVNHKEHQDYRDEEFINNGYNDDDDYADSYYHNNIKHLEGISKTRHTSAVQQSNRVHCYQ